MHGLDGVVLLSFKKYHIKEQGEVGSLYGLQVVLSKLIGFKNLAIM